MKGVHDQFVATDLNALLAALYVKIDDCPGARCKGIVALCEAGSV